MAPIVYESSNFLIADKSHGIPTVPLKGQDAGNTLLGLVSSVRPEVLEIRGKNPWEGGTLHRLDTATSGLVVFARTQAMYDYLQAIQKEDRFEKSYRAKTVTSDRLKGIDLRIDEGEPFEIVSYFRSYGRNSKEVRPTQDIKRADTSVLYKTIAVKDMDLFVCNITRGFRHQIRAHLAWIGHPIAGDAVYGNAGPSDTLELDCCALRFPMPDGKFFTFAKN